MADARKGRCRNVSFPNEEDHRESHFQTDKSNALVSYKVAESFDKESDVQISEKRECTVYNIRRSPRLTSEKRDIPCLQNRFQCDENTSQCRAGSIDKNKNAFAREAEVGRMPGVQHRYVKDGACQADSALASLTKPSASVPSFEFYVRSEEGINLFVDLTSNPSDLFMRLENEVCISQNLQNNNFPSFRQELECLGNHNKQMKSSFLKNTNSEIGTNNHYLQTYSSSNPKNIENGHVGFYQPDEGDRSLGFSAAKPGSVAIEISLHSDKEKEVPLLSTRLSSDISNKGISYTESCPRGGETTIDSNVLGTPQVILACSSVVNLTSSGLERLNTSEDQNSKLDNENCGNIALSNTCSLENPCAVHSGCSAIGPAEFQLLEVASRRNNSSSFPSDTVRNAERGDGGLADATEANPKICGNNTPACTEKWEKGNPVNGTEASDSLEKKDMVSGGTRKRKRHGKEIVDSGDQSKGRVLRSAKRLGGRDHPRRSMRLVK